MTRPENKVTSIIIKSITAVTITRGTYYFSPPPVQDQLVPLSIMWQAWRRPMRCAHCIVCPLACTLLSYSCINLWYSNNLRMSIWVKTAAIISKTNALQRNVEAGNVTIFWFVKKPVKSYSLSNLRVTPANNSCLHSKYEFPAPALVRSYYLEVKQGRRQRISWPGNKF